MIQYADTAVAPSSQTTADFLRKQSHFRETVISEKRSLLRKNHDEAEGTCLSCGEVGGAARSAMYTGNDSAARRLSAAGILQENRKATQIRSIYSTRTEMSIHDGPAHVIVHHSVFPSFCILRASGTIAHPSDGASIAAKTRAAYRATFVAGAERSALRRSPWRNKHAQSRRARRTELLRWRLAPRI